MGRLPAGGAVPRAGRRGGVETARAIVRLAYGPVEGRVTVAGFDDSGDRYTGRWRPMIRIKTGVEGAGATGRGTNVTASAPCKAAPAMPRAGADLARCVVSDGDARSGGSIALVEAAILRSETLMTMRRLTSGLALSLALVTSALALAQTQPSTDGSIEQLQPGDYLWAPEIAPTGPVTVIVSLATQKAFVYRNGVRIGVSTASTGSDGHATPTGVFTILQKDADHVSNLYKDATMPFMQRLTWGGIAMHAGNLPGYPASHGCIRLPPAFAKLLFGITRLGITVVITQDARVPVVAAIPGILMARGFAGGTFVWNPALSPSGPVSIVISGRDKRIVVLRNGIEIGSGAITFDAPVERTSAFTLQSIDADGEHWLRLPLPGDPRTDYPGTAELTAKDRAKGHLPKGLGTALATVITPGTTLLVTRETLASAGTGTPVTLIEATGQ